jgi:hypothetical protein
MRSPFGRDGPAPARSTGVRIAPSARGGRTANLQGFERERLELVDHAVESRRISEQTGEHGVRPLPAASASSFDSFSPAAYVHPGERTGSFRPGGDQLLVNENGNGEISAEDSAIAIADIFETDEHARSRVSSRLVRRPTGGQSRSSG